MSLVVRHTIGMHVFMTMWQAAILRVMKNTIRPSLLHSEEWWGIAMQLTGWNGESAVFSQPYLPIHTFIYNIKHIQKRTKSLQSLRASQLVKVVLTCRISTVKVISMSPSFRRPRSGPLDTSALPRRPKNSIHPLFLFEFASYFRDEFHCPSCG